MDPASAPLRIFIGYDERQPVAYNVLQHSIAARASRPVAITPLVLSTLPIERRGLTPFTFSRFLVPWLCGWQGWALFLDLDMLALGDIAELFGHAQPGKAVVVCQEQQRFEWASAMLFDCAHPGNRVLTPDYVEDPARCRQPHAIDWLEAEAIGSFPAASSYALTRRKSERLRSFAVRTFSATSAIFRFSIRFSRCTMTVEFGWSIRVAKFVM